MTDPVAGLFGNGQGKNNCARGRRAYRWLRRTCRFWLRWAFFRRWFLLVHRVPSVGFRSAGSLNLAAGEALVTSPVLLAPKAFGAGNGDDNLQRRS